jgi:F-type H+-transporting ATPase subunit b
MIDLDITLFYQLANFLVAWFVLNLILFKPVRGIIKKRNDYLSEQLEAAEKFSGEAESKLANYEEALESARKSGNEEKARLKEEGQDKEQEMVSDAQSQASAKIAQAKKEAQSQAEKAKKELEAVVDKMAEQAANKVLGRA